MEMAERDPNTGQFLLGHNGMGGRPKGSRNKLGEAFIADLCDEWSKSGPEALKRLASEDPASFVRVVAQVLPKEIDATLNIDFAAVSEARTFVEAYRMARDFIGAEPQEEDDPLLIEASVNEAEN
jgi:hypothetical protein